jgi:hypothetical protein
MILTGENEKYSEKNLSQCHCVHHKSHMDCPEIEPGLRGNSSPTNRLIHGTESSELQGLYTLLKYSLSTATSQKTHSASTKETNRLMYGEILCDSIMRNT